MKVRTKAPTSWALKTRRTKSDEQMKGVTDTQLKSSKGGRIFVHKVDQSKVTKELRNLKPWEYLKASGDEKLTAATQSALQSVFHTASVYREQRMHATKSMALGRVVWRRILWTMKIEVNKIRSIRRWYLVPFYYLKLHYLRWCIKEIFQCKDKIFGRFGFSYADLRKDSDLVKPKARFLRSFTTKEELFSSDCQSMTDEHRQSLRAYLLEHDDTVIMANRDGAARLRS